MGTEGPQRGVQQLRLLKVGDGGLGSRWPPARSQEVNPGKGSAGCSEPRISCTPLPRQEGAAEPAPGVPGRRRMAPPEALLPWGPACGPATRRHPDLQGAAASPTTQRAGTQAHTGWQEQRGCGSAGGQLRAPSPASPQALG